MDRCTVNRHELLKAVIGGRAIVREMQRQYADRLEFARFVSKQEPGDACALLDSLDDKEEAKAVFALIQAFARKGDPVAQHIASRAAELQLRCTEPPVRVSESASYGAHAPL